MLLQRTRCRYYRNEHYECLKTGGTGCPARGNPGERAVVLDVGPCVAPHPSSVALAMLVYDAVAEIEDREPRKVADLYGDGARDHLLDPRELLTAIVLPPPVEGEKAGYKRAISRASAEWPLAEAVAHLTVEDGVVVRAGVAVGGVAAVPLRLPDVERALTGQAPSEELFARAARVGWTPAFPETAYKIRLTETLIADVLDSGLVVLQVGEDRVVGRPPVRELDRHVELHPGAHRMVVEQVGDPGPRHHDAGVPVA